MSVAFIAGLLMSFIGSMIPTGPIALIVLKRGLGRQRFGALAIVSGAAVAEAGYALIAFLGLHLALARIHADRGRLDEALAEVDRELALVPGSAAARDLKARIEAARASPK